MSVTNSRRSNNTNTTTLLQRRSTQQEIADKKLEEDEYMSAAIGDLEWLKQSLKSRRRKSSDISYDKNGLASVHLAALHGRIDCLVWLLTKRDLAVDTPSQVGSWTPLHLCISNSTGRRSFDCLKLLLKRGANPGSKNDDQITPLHQAASEGHIQCLKALITAGADVDAVDIRGQKPIDLAKLWSRKTCARILAAEQWYKDKTVLWNQLKNMKRLDMSSALKINERETILERYREDPQIMLELINRENTPQPLQPTPEEVKPKPVVHVTYKLYNNATLWNKSTKAKGVEYVENLKDYYPRDDYTKLPKPPLVRHDSPIHVTHYQTEIMPDSNYNKMNYAKKPRLPTRPRLNVVVTSRQESAPVVFKPKHIADGNKRRHFDDDDPVQKSDVYFHLVSSLPTGVFQCKQLPISPYSEDTSTTNISEETSILDVNLRRMHRPNLLPVFQ